VANLTWVRTNDNATCGYEPKISAFSGFASSGTLIGMDRVVARGGSFVRIEAHTR
jgi:hypothetical protein